MNPKTMILSLFLALSLCASGCAETVKVDWTGYQPPPPGMGKACSPMAVLGNPSRTAGLTKMDPAAPGPEGCVAAWRCDADPCVLEMSSRPYEPGTILTFLFDVRSTAAADALPAVRSANIAVGPGGYFGIAGREPGAKKTVNLAGGKWVREHAEWALSKTPGDARFAAATLTLRKGTELAQAGWRLYQP